MDGASLVALTATFPGLIGLGFPDHFDHSIIAEEVAAVGAFFAQPRGDLLGVCFC
jgi:hypothetical protein